ncbi:MAG TPA: cytochrome oxidase subunit III [Saprospirales bacterium]|nr:cytochrome oxidase subunit III [Saprospirales bacterium]HAY70333.1 cytochrome oxidase subunit III [Saprospirales bacterium]HCR53238.1 cytochrome oxidase subunit III [Cytophagales bacterium]HRQ29415.1 cbb3-type cytochrome c oxidase N-terminal domain-containing protein [Saprospiraceae bacterium]
MWKKLLNILTNATPIEKEKDVLLDHDYDGIQELNNKLPPWWVWMFYITIIFSAIYIYRYHFSGNEWSSSKEWEEEVAAANAKLDAYRAEKGELVDENTVTVLTDEQSLKNGEVIFNEPGKCATCHKPDGGGLIGPNLTDEYWIHGGDIKDLYKTTKNGVPEKGMISWESQLSPKQMQEVTSYILVKLAGTNPPGAKAPEGEKYVAGAANAETTAADTTEQAKTAE